MPQLTNSPNGQLGVVLERRKSWAIRVRLKYADGQPVVLTGYTLRMVIKADEFDEDEYDSNNLLFNSEASISTPETGEALFGLQAAELDWDPGSYFGSLVMWTPAGYSLLLARMQIQLVANTDSASMHRSYDSYDPTGTLDLILRNSDVVEMTASNLVDGRQGDKGDKGEPGTDGTSIVVTDNGDGTLTLEAAEPAVTDNGDGTFTVGA